MKNWEFQFCKLPLCFCDETLPCYKLSANSKLLYSIMLNRVGLSNENNWQDENGTFIKFSREEMGKFIGAEKKTVTRCIRELTALGMVSEVETAPNKPNKIYVHEPWEWDWLPAGYIFKYSGPKMSPQNNGCGTKMSPQSCSCGTKMSPELDSLNTLERKTNYNDSDFDKTEPIVNPFDEDLPF